MGLKRFDRKFGREFLSESTTGPAVYLFRDGAGEVLYVGKAKNARRRLAQYRNATRRKAHRKMRAIVREAESLEIRSQPSEAEALLVENELIRTLRPPFNVEGAFDFLYPAIGVGRHEGRLVLCFTSDPEAFETLDLSWHGTFRPRWRARQAFDGLCLLFGHLGHAEPKSRLPALPDRRGARVFAARRIGRDFVDRLGDFLDGESDELLSELATALLEERGARLEASTVEAELRFLSEFFRLDAARLHEARRSVDHATPFVPGSERDALFIRSRHAGTPERA
ncbi:MAG: GIY-YIG nuclease family protein [Myxococcota bacterium]